LLGGSCLLVAGWIGPQRANTLSGRVRSDVHAGERVRSRISLRRLPILILSVMMS